MGEPDAQSRIDAALVQRALHEGDTRVFEILVRRHQGLVRAQLRRLLPDDHAGADDLAQETFVLAWRKLDQFRGEARFGTWLYRIAHACFLQHCRSRGRRWRQEMALAPDDAAFGHEARPPELGLDLDAALRHLSEPQRAALLYCVQLGLSHEEAALVMDLPLGTVKTHVLRGKARLRELLQDWSPANQTRP